MLDSQALNRSLDQTTFLPSHAGYGTNEAVFSYILFIERKRMRRNGKRRTKSVIWRERE